MAFCAMHAGQRSVVDEAFAQLRRARTEMPNLLEPNDHIVENLVFQLDDRLDLAAESAERIVEATKAFDPPDAPSAPAFRTTTTLAIERERGQLAQMGRLADNMATLGHPATPPRAIAAFIRLHAGNIEPVLAALDEIEEEEIARLDWAESLLARRDLDRARECVAGAVAVIGDLDLPDARSRIASITGLLE